MSGEIKTFVPELVTLTALNPAGYNPREMPAGELVKLMRSLEEFGFVEPVVARRSDGLIVGGHQRVAAMQAILAASGGSPATTKVPVVWLDDLTDERAKMLNLALNKIHGEWDFGKLAALFSDFDLIGDAGVLDLSGFSMPEIEDITGLLGPGALPESGAPIDLEAELDAAQRRMRFELPTQEDLAVTAEVLRQYGMTSPRDSGKALAAMARAARKP